MNVPHKGLNDLINLTPTGEKRTRLTIINMILLAIDNNLPALDKLIDCVNISEPKCPVDHSELSYGVECHQCGDRVEIKDCVDNRCLCGGKFPNNHLRSCPLAPTIISLSKQLEGNEKAQANENSWTDGIKMGPRLNAIDAEGGWWGETICDCCKKKMNFIGQGLYECINCPDDCSPSNHSQG